MLGLHLIFTVNQRVINFLCKYSDREFYERQIAQKIGIGYGSAHRAVVELYSSGVIRRRQEGKMYFYSIDNYNPIIIELKRLVNILLIEPLVESLKETTSRIVLYGSCAVGADTSSSDLDLFVVTHDKQNTTDVIEKHNLPQGYEDTHIQAIIKTPIELLESEKYDQDYIEEVETGIVLWEKAANEY